MTRLALVLLVLAGCSSKSCQDFHDHFGHVHDGETCPAAGSRCVCHEPRSP